MEYRKFRLKNSLNEYYELTNPDIQHFLYQPTGLGFRGFSTGYRFKNRYNRKEMEYDLPTVSGTMIFHKDTIQENYALYFEFMQFIQHSPLEIEYLITQYDDEWDKAKYAECDVVQIDKSETDEYGLLRTPIIFKCYTFWRDRELKTYTAKAEIEGEQLQIPMTFPFYFGKDSLRGIVIENNGSLVAPLKVVVQGTCVNPTYRIFDENGNEYGACKFDGTFSSVEVESDTENVVLRQNGMIVANPAKYEDLTIGNLDEDDYYLTFLNIKPGKNYMTASLGPNFKGEITFSWRDEWISF